MDDLSLQLFEENPLPMLLVAEEKMEITSANKAAKHAFNFHFNEIPRLCLFDLFSKDDADLLETIVQSQGNSCQETHQIIRSDYKGTRNIFEPKANNIQYNSLNYKLITLLPVHNHLPEPTKIEERLLSIINAQQEIIFRFAPDTTLLFVNDAYCSYFNVEKESAIGKSFLSYVQVDEHARIKKHIQFLTENPCPYSYEYKETFEDGRFLWWEWNDYPIIDKNGHIIEFQTVGRDITNKKIIEDKLEISERTNLQILNTLPDLVFRLSDDGIYLDAYTNNEASFYVPRSEFIGKKVHEVIPEEAANKAMSAVQSALNLNQEVSYEYDLDINGAIYHYENRIIPVSEKEVLSIIRDITKAKTSEEAIRNNERFLRKLLSMLDGALNLTTKEELLEFLAKQVKDLFKADNCFVTSWDEAKNRTMPLVADDNSIEYHLKTGNENERTLTSSLMEEGQAIIVENVFDSPYLSADIAKEFSSKSLLGIPIISNEKKYGALIIGFDSSHEFTITEIERANLATGILSLIVSKNHYFNELNDSEKMMRSFIENAPVGIMAVNRQGNYVLVNEESLLLFGYNQDEIIGMNLIEIVHPDFHQAGKEHFEKVLNNETAIIDVLLLRKDQSQFWGSVHGVKIHDDLFISFLFDISEQVNSKAALAHEKALLSGLLKSIPDVVYYKDTKGAYLGCNHELERMLGLETEQIIGKKDFDILPFDLAMNRLRQDEVIAKTQKKHIFEEIVTYPDGRIVPLETLKAPFYDLNNNLIGIVGLSRDITLRKEQEQTIRKNDNLLNDLTANLPGVLFQFQLNTDGSFNFPFLSKQVIDHFGYTSIEIQNDPTLPFRRIHKDDIVHLNQSIQLSFNTLQPWEIDFRVILPEKGKRWMRGNSVPQKLSNEAVLWHGYITDITDKKHITEDLRKSKEQLQAIFNSLHEVIWSAEMPDNKMTFISPSCQQMFGYSPEEIMKDPQIQFNLVHPDDVVLFQSGNMDILNLNEGTLEYRIITPQGQIKWLLDQTHVVKDENDNVIRIEGIISDISERKQIEIILKQNEERFDLALSFTEAGLWDWDMQNGGVYYTDTWKSMLGYQPEEIENTFEGWKQLWHPDDAEVITQAMEEYLNQKRKSYDVECRLKCKTGEWKWVQTKGKIIHNEDGEPIRWIGTNTDISKRKDLEKELIFNSSLQKILMEMAVNFINLPINQLDEAIQHALAEVGKFAETDRSYLFNYDFENQTTSNTYEWCNIGIEPQITELQNLSIDDLQDWLEKHLKNEVMIVEDIQLLPVTSTLRSILEPQEINSLITVPIYIDEKLSGFLGFDSVKNKKIWRESEVVLLRFMAEMFVNAQKRIRFEKALIESETNLNLSSEASGTGIWNVDLTTDTISINKVFGRISGLNYSKNNFQINQVLDHIHKDDYEPFMMEVNKSISGLIRTFTVEFRALKPNKSIWWAQVKGSVVEIDNEGLPVKLSGTINDITSRKRIELALKESEEQFKSIYNNSVIGLYRTSLDGNILMANKALALFHGYKDVEEFLNINIISSGLVTKVKRQAFIDKLMSQGEIMDVESTWNDVNGNQFYVSENARLVRNELGEISYIEGSVIDITHQKEAEQLLRLSEEKFRQLAENVDDVFWLRDAATLETLYINPAFERITKLSPMAFVENMNAGVQLIHPDDFEMVKNIYEFLLQTMNNIDAEFRIIVEGQEKWIRVKNQKITDATGKVIRLVGIASDVTRLKQAEQSLRETLEAEKQLGMLKSRFVSMASHEFRTPLATIQATTETLIAYKNSLNEEQFHIRLQKILSQVGYLKNVMNDVLNLAKIQEGKISFEPVIGDLLAFVCDIANDFRTHPETTHTIIVKSDIPKLTFLFDEKLMRQIISNLLTNAIKFSLPETEIKIQLKQTNEYILLQIVDQGIGIPEADLPHLFTPFFRANNVTNIQGTGLGLPIIKQAVELHNGSIEVHSIINKGTTVSCQFKHQSNS